MSSAKLITTWGLMAQGDELSQSLIYLDDYHFITEHWILLHVPVNAWFQPSPMMCTMCPLFFLLGGQESRRKLWGANKCHDCERHETNLNMSLENMFPQWLSVFYLLIKEIFKGYFLFMFLSSCSLGNNTMAYEAKTLWGGYVYRLFNCLGCVFR